VDFGQCFSTFFHGRTLKIIFLHTKEPQPIIKYVYAYRPKREKISITAKLFEETVVAEAAICGFVSLQ
jgi:hypothetical protein